MPAHFKKEIVLLLTFSIIIIAISQKTKLPVVIGFLLTGIVIGPKGTSRGARAASRCPLVGKLP
jgi:Kef-type K+ transport system membrane component KefB